MGLEVSAVPAMSLVALEQLHETPLLPSLTISHTLSTVPFPFYLSSSFLSLREVEDEPVAGLWLI